MYVCMYVCMYVYIYIYIGVRTGCVPSARAGSSRAANIVRCRFAHIVKQYHIAHILIVYTEHGIDIVSYYAVIQYAVYQYIIIHADVYNVVCYVCFNINLREAWSPRAANVIRHRPNTLFNTIIQINN